MNKKILLTCLGLLGLVLAGSASASQQRDREIQRIMNDNINQCVKNFQVNLNERKINASQQQLKTLCTCNFNLKTEAVKKFMQAMDNSVKDIESGKITVKEASDLNEVYVEQMQKLIEKSALECVKKAGLPIKKNTKTTSKQGQTQQPNIKQQTGSEIGQKIKQNTEKNIAQMDKKATPNLMSPGLR